MALNMSSSKTVRRVNIAREMTWQVFDEKANRIANLLIKRGIKKATR
jgi:hypothetical protein